MVSYYVTTKPLNPKTTKNPEPQNLAVGMKLWGCVLEVAPAGLTVSLPHGLRGTVTPEEVSVLGFKHCFEGLGLRVVLWFCRAVR
jgi:hypothetical protein